MKNVVENAALEIVKHFTTEAKGKTINFLTNHQRTIDKKEPVILYERNENNH
jgi:hypothetical protein